MSGFDAGSAFVGIQPNAAGFLTSLQRQIAPALQKIQQQGISSGAAIGTAFVAAGALAAKGLASAVHATEQLSAETLTLQRTTGLAAEQASGLIFVAESLGVATEKLNIGFGLLAKNIVNNSTGFAKYNIATRDTAGNQLDLITILGNVSDRYKEVGGGLNGAALAMNVFGRSGKSLIPILQQGSAGIQAMFEQAESFGLVIGQDAVDNSLKLQIATRQLGLSFEGFKVQVGEALIPVLTTFVGVLTDVVGVLHEIPAPLVDVTGGLLVASGALVAIVAVGRAIGSAFATVGAVLGVTTSASAAQAAATTAQLTASEALAAAMPGLTAALQGLAVVNGEVAVSAGAAAEGLLAEGAAARVATTETAVAGAAPGLGAAATSLGTLASTAALAAIGIVAVGRGLAHLTGHDERTFKVLGDDLAGLVESTGLLNKETNASIPIMGRAASAFTQLAAARVAAPAGFTTGPDIFAPLATTAASAAFAGLQQIQDDLSASSAKLGTSIAASVRSLVSLGDQAVVGGDVLGKLNIEIGRAGAGLERFGTVTGVDATSVLATFQTAVQGAAGSLPKLQDAARTALAQARATWGQWHDTIVQAFGGAGSALDAFADKSTVDLGRATDRLNQYTRQLTTFGANIKTISDEFGKRANAFIQFATSQGLAQTGLVQAVAEGNKKASRSFVDAFNTGQTATDQLASAIQNTLGKALEGMLLQLKNIARELSGQPPIDIDTRQANAALDALQRKIAALVASHPTINVGVILRSSGLDLPVIPAATGFRGTVTQPTLFLAGEGGRPEDVSIGRGGAGSGQIRGQLTMTDWHRGIASLVAEIDHFDRMSSS